MDQLWAPWRIKYIRQIGKTKGCVFCDIYKAKDDKKNFIFVRTPLSYAVLNLYPYNNGHTLVLPNRHVGDLSKLSKDERSDLWDLVDVVQEMMEEVLQPQGYNIGINLGRVGGAGFPGHLHVHIVPRWKGDVNFMPVIAETRVISQSMKTLYARLSQAYKKRKIEKFVPPDKGG